MGLLITTTMCFGEKRRPEEINEKCLKGPKVNAFVVINAKHNLLEPYWFEENGCTITMNIEYCISLVGLCRMAQDLTQPCIIESSLRGLFQNRLISLNTDHE